MLAETSAAASSFLSSFLPRQLASLALWHDSLAFVPRFIDVAMDLSSLPNHLADLVRAISKPYEWNEWQSLMMQCRVSGTLNVTPFRSPDAWKQIMACRFGEAWQKLLPKQRKQNHAASSQDAPLPDSFRSSLHDMTKPVDWNDWQKLVSSRRAALHDVGRADEYSVYTSVMAEMFGSNWSQQVESTRPRHHVVVVQKERPLRIRITGKQSPKELPTTKVESIIPRKGTSGPSTNRKIASTILRDADKLQSFLAVVHKQLPVDSRSPAGAALRGARSTVQSILNNACKLETSFCRKTVKPRGLTSQTLENLKKGRATLKDRRAKKNAEQQQ